MEKHVIEAARQLHKLSDVVRPLTALRPSSGGWIGLCPFHREKTPSFHVSDARGTFKCFGCGAWGDVFDFVMLTKGLSFQDAVKDLGGEAREPAAVNSILADYERHTAASTDDARRIKHAHEVWLRRAPVLGTLAFRYLYDTRCIKHTIPDILGYVYSAYCSPLREEVPALVAPLQDSAGHVTAVQQIFLCGETLDAYRDMDGRRIKRTLGAMRDGCVRLGLPDTTLGIAGSVEDALAASELFSLPVWATCGEARMERVWIPPEIDSLVIFADNDEPGMKAARAAQVRHQSAGRSVIIQAPSVSKDWAQALAETHNHK